MGAEFIGKQGVRAWLLTLALLIFFPCLRSPPDLNGIFHYDDSAGFGELVADVQDFLDLRATSSVVG